jgi:hypothetical protein
MDHKTHRGLHPSCHRHTGTWGQAVILHIMTFLRLQTATISPSAPLRRWRSMSPSTIESLLTLVSMMWTYLRGLVWMKSFSPSSGPTPLMVTPSLAFKSKPPPLPGTLTGTLLWSGTSVMGLTRLSTWWKGLDDLSNGWMTLQLCKRKCKHPSTHRPA